MRQKIVAKLSCLLDLLEIDIVDGEFDSLFFIQTFGDTASFKLHYSFPFCFYLFTMASHTSSFNIAPRQKRHISSV